MLFNALIKPILEYCYTLFVVNLQRLLQLQKLILDATINDSSLELIDQLVWLPIDIIRVRKLLLLHKVSQGHCPEHSTSYFKHVRSTHGYRTRSAIYNDENATEQFCRGKLVIRPF
ncbi:unnamed protein product [Porites lobata]|uniref:Uncharacterized protein n=1 Tax=Porites lobata TaxID=104759 RepID=A0ABN8RPF0_9CNID|nr:unnamed protein product [Porites lobata]